MLWNEACDWNFHGQRSTLCETQLLLPGRYIGSCLAADTPTSTKIVLSLHYVIMTTMASQITSLTIVDSTVYSDADHRKHQRSALLAFVWGIHRDRWNPRTKGQWREKCFHLMTPSWSPWQPSGFNVRIDMLCAFYWRWVSVTYGDHYDTRPSLNQCVCLCVLMCVCTAKFARVS